MRKIYILLVFVTLLLFGCGNRSAVDEAKAYKIRTETEQGALDSEQLRVENIAAAKQKAINDAYWNDVYSSALYAVKQITNFVVYAIGITVCVVALGAGWTLKETAVGLGRARVARAELEACLIHMDNDTMTFPAFSTSTVNGNHFLTMLATGQTYRLDVPAKANPLMIAALAQTAAIGMYAKEASKAVQRRGGDMAPFDPTVISGTVRDITKSS